MSPSSKQSGKLGTSQGILTLMDHWPDSWAGVDDDIPFGQGLVDEFRPFLVHLQTLGLSRNTVRRHLDSLWVIGGEIIRQLNYDPELRKTTSRQLLLETVAAGEAPLARDATETQQRTFDATARKLLRFLSTR
jgi:hypothetical protein